MNHWDQIVEHIDINKPVREYSNYTKEHTSSLKHAELAIDLREPASFQEYMQEAFLLGQSLVVHRTCSYTLRTILD